MQKLNFSKFRPWQKRGLITFLIFFVLYSITSYYIDSKIAEKITETEQVSCGQISFNLLLGNLELHDIEAIQPLKNTDQIKIQSTNINIRGLSYWQYLRYNKVVARKIIFEDLDIKVVSRENGEIPLPKKAIDREEKYEEILIKSFEIKNGRLKAGNDRFEKVKIDNFTTQIKNLQFFPNVNKDTLEWEAIIFSGNDFLINEKSKNHYVTFGNIELTNDEKLSIKAAKLVPKRNKTTFIEPLTYRKDRIDVIVANLNINRFSIKEIIQENKFATNKITVDGFEIEVFSDRTKPRCPTCFKSYFYEYISRIDLDIDIDTISVQNSKVAYEQLKAINRERGRLFWTDVDTKIYDISNIKANKKLDTKVDISANFMNKGKTQVNFSFPNLNAESDYTFSGQLGAFDLSELNSFLNASSRINIEKGEISQLIFSGRGNLETASGDVELRYNDLEIRLFKSDNSTRKLLTNLANSLIKKNNNASSEKLRKGKMFAKRDTKGLFIENWIDVLKSGLYSTLLPDIMLPDELKD